jgi:glycerate kinase
MPMGGAAGGLSGGLWARYDARLVPGADHVLAAVDFERALDEADVLVVGEGRLDRQTFEGKIAGRAAALATAAGVPVVAVVGRDGLGPDAARLGIDQVIEAGDPAALERAGATIALRAPRPPQPPR